MPELHWIGKDKVINHHLDVAYHVLERRYSYDENGKHTADSGAENMIIHGDNLLALKALLPKYEGKVDCIYIDPPYNTGYEGWVYNDNVNDPCIQKWLGEVVGKEGEDLTRHDKWLCMMYPRLRLLHRLLAPTGAIFISVDDNEQANLKLICDEIFGAGNFIGNIGWESKTKSQNTKTAYSKLQPKIEHILCYGNGGTKYKFNLISTGEKVYPLQDERGIYREHILEVMNSTGVRGRATMVYDISDGVSTVSLPEGKQWKLGQDQVATYKSQGDLLIREHKVILKMRPHQERTEKTEPFWAFFDKKIGSTESAKKELNAILGEGHGFDTVKPKDLIVRLLFHACAKDALVLDAFAGSGTTAHAVLDLNREDGGNRTFILCEMMDYADTITAERVRRVIQGYKDVRAEEILLFEQELTLSTVRQGEDVLHQAMDVFEEAKGKYTKVSKPKVTCKKRGNSLKACIQVVATQDHVEDVSGTGGSFSYYELGEPLLIDGNLNPDVSVQQVREYIWFTETREAFRAPTVEGQPYFLGISHHTAYHFLYEPDQAMTLDYRYVSTLTQETVSDRQVVYADACLLSEQELARFAMTFKKIPRDITRL